MNNFKPFYKLDDDGFVLDAIGLPLTDEDPNPPPPDGYIHIPIGAPYGLVRERWDGEKWVEGATPEEIEEAKPQLNSPDQSKRIEDIENAFLEVLDIL